MDLSLGTRGALERRGPAPGYSVPMWRSSLVLALQLVVAGPAGAAAQRIAAGAGVTRAPIDTLALRAVSRALAHDSLGGRDTGAPGSAAAARYIIRRLRAMELEPALAAGSFTQSVPIRTESVSAASRLVLRAGPDSTVFSHGAHFVILAPDATDRVFLDAEAWLPRTGHDAVALEADSVRGRVIAVVGGLPAQPDSLLRAWAANGAAAVLLLLPDSAAFASVRHELGGIRYALSPGDAAGPAGPPLPVIIAGNEISRVLLPRALLERPANRPLPATRLAARLRADATITTTELDAVNVVALIPGSDPARRHELVVYTAHYDHVGRGEPDASGDSIYNGFSDNAAGVAMLLGIADAMRREPPPRSVAFLFLTGEERGLLGSTHAARNPPWPGGLERVRALINLDGGAPPRPPIAWRIAGGLAPDSSVTPIGALADRVARDSGWTASLETARPNSDYWPFAGRGVPAVFIIPGNTWEGTSTEERDALRARWDRYHQPGDEYHEDFPFGGLLRYAEYALALGRAAAGG